MVVQIKRWHFTFLLVKMNASTKLCDFGTYKLGLHKAANEMVITLLIYVNFCSLEPRGRYKAEYFLCIIAVFLLREN